MEPAAEIALGTVLATAPELDSLSVVRFVLFSERALAVHERVLLELTPEPGRPE